MFFGFFCLLVCFCFFVVVFFLPLKETNEEETHCFRSGKNKARAKHSIHFYQNLWSWNWCCVCSQICIYSQSFHLFRNAELSFQKGFLLSTYHEEGGLHILTVNTLKTKITVHCEDGPLTFLHCMRSSFQRHLRTETTRHVPTAAHQPWVPWESYEDSPKHQ